MKLAILGFGREGTSLLKFLKKSPKYKRAEIKILDQKNNSDYLKNLDSFDLVFRSPGVPYNLPEIQSAIKTGVRFSSGTKIFFELCPAPIIGVTGTKGKGTTSTIICQILKDYGKKVLLAGNIGKPALEILPKIDKKTLVILELSSFQLQDLKKSPHIAVITDIFPDHMDVHKNMKEYLDAKSNISRHQKKSDIVFHFKDNLLSHEVARKSPGKKIAVSAPSTLEKNRVLAAAVARHLGCPENIIQKTVRKFRGLKHRLELVRSIKFHSNVLENIRMNFYNDSASTNPQTAAAAVLSFKEPMVLIAGGKDKNLDYAPLTQAIKKFGLVKLIILMGENKEKIKQALSRAKVPVIISEDLASSVKLSYREAKSLITRYRLPITVLFSPGAASFDMFRDYADRGKKYKAVVFRLLGVDV